MQSKLRFIFLSMLILQGCTADVYIPTSHPTPDLEQKGDFDGAFYTSSEGVDLHLDYALSDKLGIGTAFNYLNDQEDNSLNYQKHKYGELSAVYVLKPVPFIEDSDDSFLKTAFIGSAGLGEGQALARAGSGNMPDSLSVFAKGRYSKISLQSNIAVQSSVFAIGFSPKLSYLSFHDFKMTDTITPKTNKTNGLFWEPAIFANVQFKDVKLEAQLGKTQNLGAEPAFDFDRTYVSVGLHLNLNVFK